MKLIIKSAIIMFTLYSLAGCSYLKGKKAIIKNRDMAYLNSHEMKGLQLPPDMQNVSLDDELIIPATTATWNKQPPALIPPDSLAAAIQAGKVKPEQLKKQPAKKQKKAAPDAVAVEKTAVVTATPLMISPR